MPRKKILLSVTTYPLPSRNYDELVCTAGFLEDGSWIRLYPVPLSFLYELKSSGVVQRTKYTWIELDVEKRTDDFRPESHSPRDYEFKDLVVGERLNTDHNWDARKKICLNKVYTNLAQLWEDSAAPLMSLWLPSSQRQLPGLKSKRIQPTGSPFGLRFNSNYPFLVTLPKNLERFSQKYLTSFFTDSKMMQGRVPD
ncbi:MAG: hypothetical protein ACKVT2_16295 [Saprospiraceae bacterium]